MSAIFPLVHFYQHLTVTNPKGEQYKMKSYPFPPYNAAIDFTYNFAKDSSPQDTSVTVHGITREHAKRFFVKGSTVTLVAGWANSDYSQNNYAQIFSERITQVNPISNQDGDWVISITCTDGQKLGQDETNLSKVFKSKSVRSGASGGSGLKSKLHSITQKFKKKRGAITREEKQIPDRKANRPQKQKLVSQRKALNAEEKRQSTSLRSQYHRQVAANKKAKAKNKSKSNKHKNGKHFKKGTYASTIIRYLARYAHIHIDKINLVHNKRYNSGYTADEKPWQCIEDIADDCDSAIWWPHGKLYIGNFASHVPTNFIATPETGLLSTPELQTDDDDSNNVNTYQVTCILLPWVTVGSDFRIKDPVKPLISTDDNKEPINPGGLFNDEVVVISGSSENNSGDTPTSTLTVVRKSQENKAETTKAKSKQKKIKAKKDARERKKTKAKRKYRQNKRTRTSKRK